MVLMFMLWKNKLCLYGHSKLPRTAKTTQNAAKRAILLQSSANYLCVLNCVAYSANYLYF